MTNILIYTFKVPNQITYKVVNQLDSKFDTLYLGSLKELCKQITQNNYAYILGLGDYRRSTKYIRIENIFKNNYGNKPIIKDGKELYSSTWKLSLLNGAVQSFIPTTGPCNRSAYIVSNVIEREDLPTKFAFIHVPKHFNFDVADQLVSQWLNEI